MPDLNFSSNAEEIRYYVRKLLSDGNEHNRKEIVKYIREQSRDEVFTDGMITGAIRSLVENEKGRYEKTRRGWYRFKKDKEFEQISVNDVTDPLTRPIINILEETIKKLKDACTVNLLDVSDIDKEKIDLVSELIRQIGEFEKKFGGQR